MSELDFEIEPVGPISKKFLDRRISTFRDASSFVRNLPYGRNADKEDLLSVFEDGCGTCGTKHALLKTLAVENNVEVQLMIGIFKMNGKNTPPVAPILKEAKLDYIPEAHNFLNWQGIILDYTSADSKPKDFIEDLLVETEIVPQQITAFKVDYHKQYLQQWLRETQLGYSLEQVWEIREKCIQSLSN